MIVWLDVETTGLDPYNGDSLLQVAAIVTSDTFEEIEGEFCSTIQYSTEDTWIMRQNADPYVQNMHDTSGVWLKLKDGTPLDEVDALLVDFLKAQGVEAGTARLGGNSVTLDRNFINCYLPKTAEFLHYRSVDMTSISFFLENVVGIPYYEKNSTHDALDDIRESVAEAKIYSKALKNLIGVML